MIEQTWVKWQMIECWDGKRNNENRVEGNFLVKFKVIPGVHTRVFPFLKILYGVVGFRKDFFQIWNKNDYFQVFWVSQSVLGVPDL